tara:strand:+ start:1663 stop:1851 length:189 start_codon:yes stop_codon:yes gene_type:complete
MKSKKQIVKMIDELHLDCEQHKSWDHDANFYTNRGWIEGLEWVIKEESPQLIVTPDLQVKVE